MPSVLMWSVFSPKKYLCQNSRFCIKERMLFLGYHEYSVKSSRSFMQKRLIWHKYFSGGNTLQINTEGMIKPEFAIFSFLGCHTIHCTRGNLKKASALLCKNNNFDTNIFLVEIHFRSIPRAWLSQNLQYCLF